MGLLKDGVELAGKLFAWGKGKYQSNDWQRRLTEANMALLLEKPDLRAIGKLLQLAKEAGYSGTELEDLEERLELVEEHQATTSAGKGRVSSRRKYKRSAAKPVAKKARRLSAKKKKSTASKKRSTAKNKRQTYKNKSTTAKRASTRRSSSRKR